MDRPKNTDHHHGNTAQSLVYPITLLFAAVFQVGASSFPFIFEWGVDVGTRSRALDTAIVPSGWAFSIWSLIFIWSIIFALFAFRSGAKTVPLIHRVTYPIAGTFMANGIWSLYVPLFNIDWVSLMIISTGLSLALIALFAAGRPSALSLTEKWIVRAPIALLAGWLTAATFVGASSVLMLAGVVMDQMILLGLLASATIFAGFITIKIGGWVYLAPIAWALIAIIDKNSTGGNSVIFIAAIGAIFSLIIARIFLTAAL